METGDLIINNKNNKYKEIIDIKDKILDLKNILINDNISLIKMEIIKDELLDLLTENLNQNIELINKERARTNIKRNISTISVLIIFIILFTILMGTTEIWLLPLLGLNVSIYSLFNNRTTVDFTKYLNELSYISDLNISNIEESLKIIGNKTNDLIKQNKSNTINKSGNEKKYYEAIGYINNYIKNETRYELDNETKEILILILQNDLNTKETNLDILLPKIKDFYLESTNELEKILLKK